MRSLIISWDKKEKSLKYSFSNGQVDQYSLAEYVWFQSNRYWVERSFDDAKNELGLSGYQVRDWDAWHHHIALVMMAGLYLLKCRMKNENEYPLMSTKDARILIIGHLFATPDQLDMLYRQMGYRHLQRKRDMDRYLVDHMIRRISIHTTK